MKTDTFLGALTYFVEKGIDVELMPKTLTTSASRGSLLAGKNICHLVPS